MIHINRVHRGTPDRYPLSTLLHDRTNHLHIDAEHRPLQRELVRGVIAVEALKCYLVQIHRVHEILETQLDDCRQAHPLIDATWTEDRRKEQRLQDDLERLEAPVDAVDRLEPTYALESDLVSLADDMPVGLVGALYVFEKGTTANRVSAKEIRTRSNFSFRSSYFDMYGEDQPRMWSAFTSTLDAATVSITERAAILHGACRTYRAIAELSDAVSREAALTTTTC
jgi:heme oxygenase